MPIGKSVLLLSLPMHLLDEMDQDQKEADWRFQHLGWSVLALLFVMTGIGFFGDGPLSVEEATVETDGATYGVEYARWGRMTAVDHMTLRIHAPDATGDELSIVLSSGLGDKLTIRTSIPETEGGGLRQEGSAYTWKVDDWDKRHQVVFEYFTTEPGRHVGDITIEAEGSTPARLPFSTFSFP